MYDGQIINTLVSEIYKYVQTDYKKSLKEGDKKGGREITSIIYLL